MHDHDTSVHTAQRGGLSRDQVDTIVNDDNKHTTSSGVPGDTSGLYTQEQVQKMVDAAYEKAALVVNSAACHAYSFNERQAYRILLRVIRSIRDLKGSTPE